MKTRYPIVLVHGLAMRDTFFMKSWGSIDRILRIQGYEVYKSQVDAFGTVKTNAAQLKEEILTVLRETGADKVNIIAHSKGGLDAKYMIRYLEMAPYVASLTTLCTPHAGSPIASFILRFPKPAVKYVAFWVNTAYRVLGDQHPDSFAACEELKRTQHLETETMNLADGILCQSFSSTIQTRKGKQDFVMTIPHIFSRFIEKDRLTDGQTALFPVIPPSLAITEGTALMNPFPIQRLLTLWSTEKSEIRYSPSILPCVKNSYTKVCKLLLQKSTYSSIRSRMMKVSWIKAGVETVHGFNSCSGIQFLFDFSGHINRMRGVERE